MQARLFNADNYGKGHRENSHSKHAGLKKNIYISGVKGLLAQSLISRSRHREGNMMVVRDSLVD